MEEYFGILYTFYKTIIIKETDSLLIAWFRRFQFIQKN